MILERQISTTLGNYYIGRLATVQELQSYQSPVFEQNTKFRVNIKIVSDIPEELRDVLSYTNNVIVGLDRRVNPVLYSDVNPIYEKAPNAEKRKMIINDLSKALVIFKLERKDTFYNLISASIKIRNEPYSTDETYETVPYFKVNDAKEFIQKVESGMTISNLRGSIENRLFDEGVFDLGYVPPYILIHEGNGDDVYAYGPLKSMERGENGSLFFAFSDKSREFKMNDSDFLYNNYNNLGEEEFENISKISCYFINTIASKLIREKLKTHEKLKVDEGYRNNAADEKKEMTEVMIQAQKVENEIINRFKESAESKGLYYKEKDLYNFHTAMKTGNMVILAGMSGTGKSKIVDCYGEALGLIDSGRLLKIPVRPFWQDDSDLLGYLDVLNNIYRPGESGLIDFLMEAEKKSSQMFIVCFDEMNLARVEHYFSQFLSVLENEEGERNIRLYNEEYQNRLYNSHNYNDILKVGSNVLFVGTVNLDESTYHFSDKVLDRANIINLELRNFNDVYQAAKNYKVTDGISTAIYKKEDYFGSRPDSLEENKFSLTENEIDFLWQVHEEIKLSNDKSGVGFRIVRQIDRYLQCLPENTALSREMAFDLQILQRILTKIRGSEEQLTQLVGAYDKSTKETRRSVLLDLFNKHSALSDFDESRKKVSSLSKELSVYGHTL
jgi:replicative DNA helicase